MYTEDPYLKLQYFSVVWLILLSSISSFTLEMFHIVWTLGYTHPQRDSLKSGLGKCWTAQLSFMKNGDTDERGAEIAGGLTHSKKSGTCWLSGVFLCFWPAKPLSIISVSFVSGAVFTHWPLPLSMRHHRQAGGAREWWSKLQYSRGDETVFTLYFLSRSWDNRYRVQWLWVWQEVKRLEHYN